MSQLFGALADPVRSLSAVIEVVVEVPRGSRNRYRYDHERQTIRLDRRIFSATTYPADCGFVAGTMTDDGRPLDAIVLAVEPTFPGCHVDARPVGILMMADGFARRDKILCVPRSEIQWIDVTEIAQLPVMLLAEIRHFFQSYQDLDPGGSAQVTSFAGRAAARSALEAAMDLSGHASDAS